MPEADRITHGEQMLRKTREIGALATEGTGGEAVELETRFLLRSFWESAAGFWGKRGTRASSVLSGILLLIVVGNLVDSYGMNVRSRVIFDALEKRDSATVLELSILYSRLLAGSVFLTVLRLWARVTMQRRWREWLNKRLIDRWLKNGRYYQFNLVGSVHKNPECRIADDVRIATEAPVEFAAGATSAVLSADMRAGAKLLVLPQRPYLPIGTLRRAATYPEAAESRSVEPVAKVLEKVELGYLVERVDEHGPWDDLVGWRETAAGVRATPAPSPGCHRARRSYRSPRHIEPESRYRELVAGAQRRNRCQHGSSS
jgi:ABC-type uncharacterized transport system fused permease/ATPase subunit